jgi:hypothetical protein
MKRGRLVALVGLTLLAWAGCAKKADVKSRMSDLEQSFPSATAPNARQTEAAQYVSAALSAVRQNDYAAGVVALQSVKRAPDMTPDQLRVVQDTIQALTSDLVARADRGDPQAKAALSAIERTRSQ